MIHTFKVFFNLTYQEVQDIQSKFNITYREANKYFENTFPGVTISITKCRDGNWRLYIVVDAIELLGKSEIKESDYILVEKNLKKVLFRLFGHSAHYENHVLIRLDYRYDVVIQNENERLLLLTLYKKLTKSKRFQKKYLGKKKKGRFIPYKTTVYHSAKSIESMVYDKEKERNAKKKEIKKYEQNVIRYEIHLKRDHLYYVENRKKDTHRNRKLKEYMKEQVYREYYQKYMFHIYHPGDFYKIEQARKALKSSSLSNLNRKKLIDFLKLISSHSVDTPLKKMTKGTLNKRLAMLKQAEINPILIPKNYTSEDKTFKAPLTLENPLKNFPR